MINRIGIITESIATDDQEIFETVQWEGWHVNATSPIDGMEDYQVTPSTPYNVFYGVPTYYYVFKDKAECDALLGEELTEIINA